MARLEGGTLKASVHYQGEEVVFHLRQPSNEELNRFLSSRFELAGRKGKVQDNSNRERCAFFDKLFEGVEKLEAPDGSPVTRDTLVLVPANWKIGIIVALFEDTEIEIKN